MTDNVVPFKPKTVTEESEDEGPYMTGEAWCLGCKYKWLAIAPVGTFCLECPECHANKGHYMNFQQPEGDRWQCTCGCQLFFLTSAGVMCPNCGVWQHGF